MRILLTFFGIPFALLAFYFGDSIWQQVNKIPDPHGFESAEVYCRHMLGEYTEAIGTRELDLGRTSVVCMSAHDRFPQEFVRAADGSVMTRHLKRGFTLLWRYVVAWEDREYVRARFLNYTVKIGDIRTCGEDKLIGFMVEDLEDDPCAGKVCKRWTVRPLLSALPVCYDAEDRSVYVLSHGRLDFIEGIRPPMD